MKNKSTHISRQRKVGITRQRLECQHAESLHLLSYYVSQCRTAKRGTRYFDLMLGLARQALQRLNQLEKQLYDSRWLHAFLNRDYFTQPSNPEHGKH